MFRVASIRRAVAPLAVAFLLCLSFVAPLAAQTWTELAPHNAYFGYTRGFGYDAVNNVTVYFIDNGFGTPESAALLIWDGSSWSVYDDTVPFDAPILEAQSGQLIVGGGKVYYFGGQDLTPTPDAASNELWVLNLSNLPGGWTKLSPGGTAIPALLSMGSCYDAANNRLLFWGGSLTAGGTRRNDLWAYNIGANTWQELQANGAPGNPTAMWDPVMAIDPERENLILVGLPVLSNPSETWELDLTTMVWTQKLTATNTGVIGVYATMFYSDARKRIIISPAYFSNKNIFEYNPFTENWVAMNNNHPNGLGDTRMALDGQGFVTMNVYGQTHRLVPTANAAPLLDHVPITQSFAGLPQSILTVLNEPDQDDLASGQPALYYRTGTAGPFTSVQMTEQGGGYWAAIIPSGAMVAGTVQYYIEAIDHFGNTTRDGNSVTPHSITAISFGSLTVNIDPVAVRSLGAQWSIDGGTNWFPHGHTLVNIPAGSYTITFDSVTNWDKPADITGVVVNQNALTSRTGTYVQHLGSITGTIAPAGAIAAGGKWSIDGGTTWRDSGTTVSALPVGNYTVTFKPVDFWTTPANQNVAVVKDGTATPTGTYVQHIGSITVTITPTEAVDGGAQWSIDGGTTWNDSGATLTNVPGGNYTLSFKTIPDWFTPISQAVTVNDGLETTAGGTYTQHTGSVSVEINPPTVRDLGARWSIDGGLTWNESGITLTAIPVGDYSVSFKPVANWATPASEAVTVTNGGLAEAVGIYTEDKGSLRVTIVALEDSNGNPAAGPIDNGAQWRLSGYPDTWYNSGQTATGLVVGTYTVQFKSVPGWARPADIGVTIVKDQLTTAEGAYSEETASLSGRVVDDNGTPLWDVAVTASTDGMSFEGTINAANDGYFTFPSLPANRTWTVTVVKPGYTFSPAKRSRFIDDDGAYTLPDFVGVYNPADLSISGQVRTIGGKGLAGRTVLLNGSIQTETDGLGNFSFKNLPSGAYTVQLQPVAKYIADGYVRNVVLQKNSADGIDFVLTPANLEISGKVMQYDGVSGLAGITIKLEGPVELTTVSNGAGIYKFGGIPGGSYTVKVVSDKEFKTRSLQVNLVDYDAANVNFITLAPKLNELKVGNLTVTADEIRQQTFAQYFATGNVYVHKAQMIRAESELDLNIVEKTMTGSGRVWAPTVPMIGGMEFYNGPFVIEEGSFDGASSGVKFDLFFFKFELTGLNVRDEAMDIRAYLFVNLIITGTEIEVELEATKSKTKLKSFDYFLSELVPFSEWGLSDTTIYYHAEDEEYGGGTTLNTPFVVVQASIKFFQGLLDALAIRVEADVPIYPPYLYLNWMSGGVANIAKGEPLEIDAGAGFSGGKQVAGRRLLGLDVNLHVALSGSFSAQGDIYIIGIKTGGGGVSYTHNPSSTIELNAWFAQGIVPRLQVNGNLGMSFRPFNVWGSVSAQIYLEIEVDLGIYTITKRFDIGDAGGEYQQEKLRIWATVLGANLEAYLDGNGFRITAPGWLTSVKFDFNEPGREPTVSRVAQLTANNDASHEVPDGLASAHFLVAWEKDKALPQLISPGGDIFSADQNRDRFAYFEDTENHLATFSIPTPDAGTWQVKFTGKPGAYSVQPTLYPFAPGVAITDVQQDGDGRLITLMRSGLEGETVDLLYTSAGGGRGNHPIASAEELGAGTTWHWDTSAVPPGEYYVLARVSDEANHPFIYRYPQKIRIEGAADRRITGRPAIKIQSRGARVSWQRMDDADLSYYRVYYSTDAKTENYSSFKEVEPSRSWVVLDRETITPGRRYTIAVAPVFRDGSEGPRSLPKSFTYRSKKFNNQPWFDGAPANRVKLGSTYRSTVKAVDFDKDTLYFNLRTAPKGMTIDYRSGEITWKPGADQIGSHPVVVLVTDGKGGEDLLRHEVRVKDGTRQGMLEVRPVRDHAGRTAYVVSYWNPNLNGDRRRAETLRALIGTAASPAGLPLELHESGIDHGYFAAFVPADAVQQAVSISALAASATGTRVQPTDLDLLRVTMQGRDRGESITFRKRTLNR